MGRFLSHEFRLLFAAAAEKDRWAALGRQFEYLVKWNPRRQDKDSWITQAQALGAFIEKRPGKREALFSMNVERSFGKQTRRFRLVIRLIERTISKHGQHLLLPDTELEGW